MLLGQLWNHIIQRGAESGLTEIEFFEAEIADWLHSEARQRMVVGRNYYNGIQDILQKERTAIGENGHEVSVHNIPNSRLVDNRYAELVDQKVAYLLSNVIDIKSDDEKYGNVVRETFGKRFRKVMRLIGEDMLNAGIAFLYPYVAEDGSFRCKRFAPEQVMPFWKDEEHEELDCFLRFYPTTVYEGRTRSVVYKVEHYTASGMKRYTWENNKLIPETQTGGYMNIQGKPYNWDKVPLVAFKYNQNELPLITRVKCLQDALNTLISDFSDNMRENVRNTILILENYGGEDLGSFRRNLATYGVVKVGTEAGQRGDVRRLTIDVNSGNYDVIVRLLKRAIIENGHGFDSKDDRMSNNPNQMNIKSIYADIDLDADNMEMEIQTSLDRLMWFVNTYLGLRKVASAPIEFVFHRDTPINEAEIIENCAKSEGVISKETILANHPWVLSVSDEMERLEKEKSQEQEAFMADYVVKDDEESE